MSQNKAVKVSETSLIVSTPAFLTSEAEIRLKSGFLRQRILRFCNQPWGRGIVDPKLLDRFHNVIPKRLSRVLNSESVTYLGNVRSHEC